MAAETEFRIVAKNDPDYEVIVKAAKIIVEQERKEIQEEKHRRLVAILESDYWTELNPHLMNRNHVFRISVAKDKLT